MAVGPDGALYVGDDFNGIIYRVAYASPPAGGESAAAFKAGEPIPKTYAAEGDNISPPLSWTAPEAARSLVVILDDPDAAEPKPFTHWIAYDIPGAVTALREGLPREQVLVDPKGLKQGMNGRDTFGYAGPNPPVGAAAHNYHLQDFVLDTESLGIDPGATRAEVLEAMTGKVLAKGKILGTYQR